MLDYKHRKIELITRQNNDGTWLCPYRIFEFRTTCWGYHKGCPKGIFASREAAAAAALKEAKCIVDSLQSPTQGPRSMYSRIRKTEGDRIERLFAYSRRS
jgi:hypothetical protein